jgi:hypothetical protein
MIDGIQNDRFAEAILHQNRADKLASRFLNLRPWIASKTPGARQL